MKFRRVKTEAYETLEMIFSLFPGFIGVIIRRLFYKVFIAKAGKKFSIGVLSKIQQPNAIYLGEFVAINDRAWIAANVNGGSITIGNHTIIGPNVVIHSGNHLFKDRDRPIMQQGYKFAPIEIQEGVWIAANCTILSGVQVGKGAVVAAGSIVNKNVPSFAIVAGVPAKVIGYR